MGTKYRIEYQPVPDSYVSTKGWFNVQERWAFFLWWTLSSYRTKEEAETYLKQLIQNNGRKPKRQVFYYYRWEGKSDPNDSEAWY